MSNAGAKPITGIFKKLGTAVLVLIIGLVNYLVIDSYWYTDIRPVFFGKVITDPDDPKFDPMHFRFEYYSRGTGNRQDLPSVFLKMFPPGADKEHVDSILLEQADAIGWKLQPEFNIPNSFRYQWPDPNGYFGLNGLGGGHIVIVEYGNKGGSIRLDVNGARLYGAETESDRRSFTPQIRAELEQNLRPLRKKYLGDENGFLIGGINGGK